MNLVELKGKSIAELTSMADDLKVEGVSGMRKQELIFAILQAQTEKKRHDLRRRGPGNTSGRFRLPQGTGL